MLCEVLTFVSGGEEETWDEIKNRLMENVRLLAESGLEHNDPVEEMFAEEVEKTVHLLDLFVQNYDVVISNPPYLNSGKMGENLKNFVKQYQGSRDLYSAFIERNLGFVSESGYVSMITMETFMYLSTFEDLRQNLLSRANFVDAAHLENRDEGYMNICFLMRAATEEDNPPSRFNRVLDLDEKIQGLNEITKSNRQSGTHESAYVVNQNSFTSVDGLRFLYWFGADLLSLFEEYPKLGNESISEISGGIKSGDNSHFLRKVWEIPDSWIGEKYQWFVKGGEGRDFYDKIDMLVRWENQGQNIIDYCDKCGKNYQGLSNPDWYSGESIIFRKFGNVLRAKYLPEDTKFSSGIYKIKPGDEIQDLYLLGYLNSNLFRYIIDGANPSMNFNPSDAELVPIKTDLPEEEETRITELVQLCIDRRKKTLQVMESEKEFDEEYLLSLYQNDITDPKYIEEIYLSDFLILQGKLNQEIFNLYEIPIETREKVNNSFQSNMANYPHITNAGELDTKEQKFRSEIPTKSLPDSEYEKLVSSVDELKGQSLEDISEELEISPYTIAMIRHERGIYSGDEQNEMAGRLLSYYIGCSIGRWDIKGIDPKSDGILETHKEAPTYIRECLEVSFDKGEIENIGEQIENMLGREIEDWIQNRFFRYHHSDEYKRRGQRIPVYWHIESPEGAFSCFLYYHQIDNNTLAKLRGQYLDPRINKLENELETLETQTNGDSPDKDLLNRKEEVQNDLDDIREFRETIDEMIDDGVTVDVEKGIWENIKEWDQYEVLETGLPKLKSSYSR